MHTKNARKNRDSIASADLDELENKLQARLGGRIRHFKIVPRDFGIVLRGSAQTYHAKQIAQHTIMTETALPIMANEIEVA